MIPDWPCLLLQNYSVVSMYLSTSCRSRLKAKNLMYINQILYVLSCFIRAMESKHLFVLVCLFICLFACCCTVVASIFVVVLLVDLFSS